MLKVVPILWLLLYHRAPRSLLNLRRTLLKEPILWLLLNYWAQKSRLLEWRRSLLKLEPMLRESRSNLLLRRIV